MPAKLDENRGERIIFEWHAVNTQQWHLFLL